MNYLVDTNIWLERMLEQERAAEVAELLTRVPSSQLCMTDFTLHSIGVILYRLKQPHLYTQFVQDVLIDRATRLLTVPLDAVADLVEIAAKYRLDFDDAYQYAAATRHHLTIISLDADFDRTRSGRQTPAEIVRQLGLEVEDE